MFVFVEVQIKDSDASITHDKGKDSAGVWGPGYIIHLVANIIAKYGLYMENIFFFDIF